MSKTTEQAITAMTEAELYKIYSVWTGQLHHYCQKYLGAQLNCEFDPQDWTMKLYPGPLKEKPLQPWGFATVPGFERPRDAPSFRLPRPESDPTQIELDQSFRALCYAAAQVLKIDVSKAKLEDGPASPGDPAPLAATHEPTRPSSPGPPDQPTHHSRQLGPADSPSIERPGPETQPAPGTKKRAQRKKPAG